MFTCVGPGGGGSAQRDTPTFIYTLSSHNFWHFLVPTNVPTNLLTCTHKQSICTHMLDKEWKLRVSEQELSEWKAAAAEEGMLLSEWIREVCNGEIQASPKSDGLPDVRKDGGIRVSERGVDSGVGVEVPVPNADKARKPVATCKHGTEKGWRCWQCGGKAVVE